MDFGENFLRNDYDGSVTATMAVVGTLRPNIALLLKIISLALLLTGHSWPLVLLVFAVLLFRNLIFSLPAYAIWANVLLGSGLLMMLEVPLHIWIYCMLALIWLFIEWPASMLVIYDGDCGLCNRLKSLLERLDFDRLMTWQPYQSDMHGIEAAALEEKMHVILNGRKVFTGYAAFQQILLFSSWFWLTVTVLLAAPPEGWIWWRRIVVIAVLCLFLPIFQPAGEIVYSWVARNRRRIFPGSTCGLKNV